MTASERIELRRLALKWEAEADYLKQQDEQTNRQEIRHKRNCAGELLSLMARLEKDGGA